MASNPVVSATTAAAAVAAAAAAASCLPGAVPFTPSLDPQRILVLHCELCSYMTLDISRLFEHCLARHPNSSLTCSLHQCNHCGIVTTYEPLLEDHHRAWHPYDKPSIRCLSQTRWNTASASSSGGAAEAGSPVMGRSTISGRNLRRCVFCAFSTGRWSTLSSHYSEVHNVARVAKGIEEIVSLDVEPGCSSSSGQPILSPLPAQRKRRLMSSNGGGSGGTGNGGGDEAEVVAEGVEDSKQRKVDGRLLHQNLTDMSLHNSMHLSLPSMVNGAGNLVDPTVDLEDGEAVEEEVEEELEEEEDLETEEEEGVVMVKQELPSSPYTTIHPLNSSVAGPVTALPSVMTLRASPFGPTVFPSMMSGTVAPTMISPLRQSQPTAIITASSPTSPNAPNISTIGVTMPTTSGSNGIIAGPLPPSNLPGPLAAMLRHPMAPPNGPPRGPANTSPVELLTNGQSPVSAASAIIVGANSTVHNSFTSTPKLPHGAEFRAVASATGGYTCQYCAKVYRSRKYCAEHEYTCSGLVRLQCACGLVCKWRSYYYSHRKSCPVYLASVARPQNSHSQTWSSIPQVTLSGGGGGGRSGGTRNESSLAGQTGQCEVSVEESGTRRASDEAVVSLSSSCEQQEFPVVGMEEGGEGRAAEDAVVSRAGH